MLSISHPEMFNIHMRRSGTVKHNKFFYSNIYFMATCFDFQLVIIRPSWKTQDLYFLEQPDDD
jgi:hypothetical protein